MPRKSFHGPCIHLIPGSRPVASQFDRLLRVRVGTFEYNDYGEEIVFDQVLRVGCVRPAAQDDMPGIFDDLLNVGVRPTFLRKPGKPMDDDLRGLAPFELAFRKVLDAHCDSCASMQRSWPRRLHYC